MRKAILLWFASLSFLPAAVAQGPTPAAEDTTAVAARCYATASPWGAMDLGNDEFATFEGLVQALELESWTTVDLSNAALITMPEPRLAYVNLTGITDIPTTNRKQMKAWMEVYDGQGRYFRKPLLVKGQGGYTLRFPKRNFSVAFCDTTWTEESTPDFYIGDWVRQDGFHFKAFYTDFIRGIGEIGYKCYHKIAADRPPFWERGGYFNESQALCVPDGFPCIVYLNGKFWGIYAWQLKKHRHNMNMKKKVAEHIHLDGNINDKELFDGNVNWKWIEVRNPKQLYTHKGKPYEANIPDELMDENSEGFDNEADTDEAREDKVRSAQVKQYVLSLSRYRKELSAFEEEGEAVFKREFEKRFDVQSLLDYQVFYRMQMNGDGTQKNWQWFTYDGVKWMVTPYDLDQTFGITLYGFPRPATHTLSTITTGPFPFISKYYAHEEADRYAELRTKGVLSEETILSVIYDWHDRVGADWYEREKMRWPESPCYCEAICNDGWKVCNDWSRYHSAPSYADYKKYKPGDICVLDGRLWEATKNVTEVFPYIRNSDIDTIERLVGWVSERLRVLDEYYDYKPEEMALERLSTTTNVQQTTAIYTADGRRISRIRKGINIVQSSDGTSRIIYHK